MLKINTDEIKLVVTDVDGTLINDEGILPNNVKDILLELQANNIIVSIASGRLPMGFYDFAKELKIDSYCDYIIGGCGSVLMRVSDKQLLTNGHLNKDIVKDILLICKEQHCNFILSYTTENTLYCYDEEMLASKTEKDAYLDGMLDAKLIDWNNIKDSWKIVIKADDIIRFNDAVKKIRDKFDEEVTIDLIDESSCDIVAKDVNKAKGIQNLVNILNDKYNINIAPNNILYFGDNHNDVAAFQYVKYGVALKNAPENIQKHAYDVTKYDNDNEGIYYYLQDLINNSK